MREIASAEIFVVVRELRDKLVGKRLNNFYDLGSGSFRLDFEGNLSVYVLLTKTLNETKFKERAQEATPFSIALRKRIKGSRLAGMEQKGSDRIVVFEFAGASKQLLVLEMFAKGNMLLLDSQRNIELVYASRKLKERALVAKARYSFPRSDAIDFRFDEKAVLDAIARAAMEQDAKLITALSKYVNIGPIYLEELIRKAGLDPVASSSKLLDKQRELAAALLDFRSAMDAPKPVAYCDESDKVVDYAILPISKYAGYKRIEYATLSQLLDDIYAQERTKTVDEERERALNELRKSIETQKELENEYAAKAGIYREIANKIFEHMSAVNEAISAARQKKGEEEIAIQGIKVLKIDRQNKVMHIEME
ncbi:MAG: NFACT family protein [Candidatus Micrarchaeia archaeon]